MAPIDSSMLHRYVYLQSDPDEILLVRSMLRDDFTKCFSVVDLMRLRAAQEVLSPYSFADEMEPSIAAPSVAPARKFRISRSTSDLRQEDTDEERSETRPGLLERGKAKFSSIVSRVKDFVNEGEEDDFDDEIEEPDDVAPGIDEPHISYSIAMSAPEEAHTFLSLLQTYLNSDD